jgi:predicted ferric reductase
MMTQVCIAGYIPKLLCLRDLYECLPCGIDTSANRQKKQTPARQIHQVKLLLRRMGCKKTMSPAESLSASTRIILGTLILSLALLVLAGGWTIPYTFESFSILYKFGMEKTYLRSGKIIGITTAVLVFFQVILASRFRIFEQVFSVKRLLALHRINGMTIAFLVICHPLLIKVSENFTSYTFEKKYYPEFLGIALLTVLLLLSLTAIFRNYFKLPYAKWVLLHRFTATLALLMMPAHILFVSESFKSGIPLNAALVIFSLNLLMIIRVWLRKHLQKAQ